MEQEDVNNRVATILDGVQDAAGAHARLMKELSTLCEVAGPEKVLRKALMPVLSNVLVVFKREPCVERVVSFLIQFASQCLFEVQGRPFPVYFMMHLLPYTKASKGSKDTEITKAVRFRATQLVAGTLNALGEETELKYVLSTSFSDTPHRSTSFQSTFLLKCKDGSRQFGLAMEKPLFSPQLNLTMGLG